MTDAKIAEIGRQLAFHLRRYAHDRDDRDAKTIAVLHYDLCSAVRTEEDEERAKQQPPEQPT